MVNTTLPFAQETWMVGLAAAAVILAVLLLVFRHRFPVLIWRSGAVVLAALVAAILADAFSKEDRSAQRQALDTRAGQLAVHALAPGSVLGCLNRTGNNALDEACRKAVFGSAGQVAAALSYVDAQLAILLDAADIGDPDRGSERLQRMRMTLQADEFGMVAHLLEQRGCTASDCPQLGAIGSSERVLSNLKERTFDSLITVHAPDWERARTGSAIAQGLDAFSNVATGAQATMPAPPAASVNGAAATGTTLPFDFPSADSIPAVSIMDAEPPRRQMTPIPPPRRP